MARERKKNLGVAWREIVERTTCHGGQLAIQTLLWLGQFPYAWAVATRNRIYDHYPHLRGRTPLPVISVGNLTLGGTGKSPFVRWLARWFLQRHARVAVLSRGYRAARGQLHDEGLELRWLLPEVLQFVQRDRLAAARQVAESQRADILILDDGYQHRRLERDLDILMVDALCPFALGTCHEYLFPRGILREPVREARRATTIVLTRSDRIAEEQKSRIRERLDHVAPTAIWVEAVEKNQGWIQLDGDHRPLDWLRDRRVFAFCGIGNPRAFSHSLREAQVDVVELVTLPDHAAYDEHQITQLRQQHLRHVPALPLVCTLKDLVKLRASQPFDNLLALHTELEIVHGREALEDQLERVRGAVPHPTADPQSVQDGAV